MEQKWNNWMQIRREGIYLRFNLLSMNKIEILKINFIFIRTEKFILIRTKKYSERFFEEFGKKK